MHARREPSPFLRVCVCVCTTLRARAHTHGAQVIRCQLIPTHTVVLIRGIHLVAKLIYSQRRSVCLTLVCSFTLHTYIYTLFLALQSRAIHVARAHCLSLLLSLCTVAHAHTLACSLARAFSLLASHTLNHAHMSHSPVFCTGPCACVCGGRVRCVERVCVRACGWCVCLCVCGESEWLGCVCGCCMCIVRDKVRSELSVYTPRATVASLWMCRTLPSFAGGRVRDGLCASLPYSLHRSIDVHEHIEGGILSLCASGLCAARPRRATHTFYTNVYGDGSSEPHKSYRRTRVCSLSRVRVPHGCGTYTTLSQARPCVSICTRVCVRSSCERRSILASRACACMCTCCGRASGTSTRSSRHRLCANQMACARVYVKLSMRVSISRMRRVCAYVGCVLCVWDRAASRAL